MERTSLTFRELIADVARKSDKSQRVTGDFIREMTRLIEDSLMQGERIDIHGFGSFHLKRIQEHDPETGQWKPMKVVDDIDFTPTSDFMRFLRGQPAAKLLGWKSVKRSKKTGEDGADAAKVANDAKVATASDASKAPKSPKQSKTSKISNGGLKWQKAASLPKEAPSPFPLLVDEDGYLVREIDPIEVPESIREEFLAILEESENTDSAADEILASDEASSAVSEVESESDWTAPDFKSFSAHDFAPKTTSDTASDTATYSATESHQDATHNGRIVSGTPSFEDELAEENEDVSQAPYKGLKEHSGWSKQATGAILFASAIAFAMIYQMRSNITTPAPSPESDKIVKEPTRSSSSNKTGASASASSLNTQTVPPVSRVVATASTPTLSAASAAQFGITTQIQVERGQSLWSIAEKHLGDPYLWPWIVSLNPELNDPNRIIEGESLTIPVRAQNTTLTEGEMQSVALGYLSLYEWLNELGRTEARDFLWAAIHYSSTVVRDNLLNVSQRDIRYAESLLASLD